MGVRGEGQVSSGATHTAQVTHSPGEGEREGGREGAGEKVCLI